MYKNTKERERVRVRERERERAKMAPKKTFPCSLLWYMFIMFML